MSALGRGKWGTARLVSTASGAGLTAILLLFAIGGCGEDSHATPDAGADGPPGVTDGTVYEAMPTGDVTGSIVYQGAKRGTVVIAFLSHIPGSPGAPPGPPKVGGFALSNPTTYPGTYSAKIAPGTWVVSAYMTTGQPRKLDGPRLNAMGVPTDPVDPRQPPPSVTVVENQTATADIVLIDIPDGPPPGDGGDASDQ